MIKPGQKASQALEVETTKNPKGSIKTEKADRAMDNMFRIAIKNHLALSAMADAKAGMMITVCALIVALTISKISDPDLKPAIIAIAMTCVGTILFAILSTVPQLPPRLQGKVDPYGQGFNLMFFGHFSQLRMESFLLEIEKVLNNRDIVYESLAKDLYQLGKILGERKYKYLRISYQIFMVGLFVSLLILVFSLSNFI